MKIGDKVFIIDRDHPWWGNSGEVVAVDEKYGLGWMGNRVKLDGHNGETYVKSNQVKVA